MGTKRKPHKMTIEQHREAALLLGVIERAMWRLGDILLSAYPKSHRIVTKLRKAGLNPGIYIGSLRVTLESLYFDEGHGSSESLAPYYGAGRIENGEIIGRTAPGGAVQSEGENDES